jgi:thiol-disulfide isomerase/thioredoxin
MLSTLVVLLAAGVVSDGVSTKFVASGATAKAGGYRPLRADMKDKEAGVKTAPEGLASPKYGRLKLSEKSWGFILDEPEDQPARLFVDGNGDGDYTNDPEAKWTPMKAEFTMYQGEVEVKLEDDQAGTLRVYRFDPADPARAQFKNTLFYFADYGYEVTFQLDDKSYTSFVAGEPNEETAFWIDRDGNKKPSYKLEMAQVGKPFNFTGTTYVIKASGGKLSLDEATEPLPMKPLPPDLSIGKPALPFEMETMEGAKIDFPKTYAGKLVMLDFWATWCGPCIREIPNVKEAYEAWHDDGFEILGISFDDKDMAGKVTEFTKKREMPWQQIYEGKLWNTTLGEKYDVGSIPFVLLVDGDSGEILATAAELRGPGLKDFIGKALAKKNGESDK